MHFSVILVKHGLARPTVSSYLSLICSSKAAGFLKPSRLFFITLVMVEVQLEVTSISQVKVYPLVNPPQNTLNTRPSFI